MHLLDMAEPGALGLCPQRIARMRTVLQDEVDRRRVPGAVVLVARRGRIGLCEAIGVQDPAGATPMAPDTIFRLYSMTKPIVSVAVMMLLEQGRFLLSDPVAKYLPAFANQQVAVERDGILTLQPALRPATVHDLLRHTAGLTYEFSGDSAVQRMYREHQVNIRVPGRDNAAAIDALGRIPLMFQPGSVGDYSRATDVLGRLVEVWSGQPLGAFLRQHILEPLGMHDTGFSVPPAHHGRMAEPFAQDPDGGPLTPMFDVRVPPQQESGGGGLVGTVTDYARFLLMLRNKGELGGVRLLGPRTVDYMTCDHLGNIPAQASLLEPGEGFGLGFAIRTSAGVTPVPGSVGTYYWSGMGGTNFFVDPAQDLFAVMMIQGINQRSYYRQLFRSLVYAAVLD